MQKFAVVAAAGAFLGQVANAHQMNAMTISEPFELSDVEAFAQVDASVSDKLRCGEPMNRLKAPQKKFSDLLQGEGKFADDEFDEAQAMNGLTDYKWQRMSDVFKPEDGYSLWGTNGVNFDEINQGQLGNCWTLSAMQTIAEYPDRIQELFANPYLNDKGVYAVQMYALGIPVTVVVDDYIPMATQWWMEGTPKFGKPDDGKGLWPIILEKAIAKYFGSYESIVGGEPSKAVFAFTGAPGRYTPIQSMSEAEIWKQVLATNESRDQISIGTYGRQYSNGLVQGHAYAVLGAYELSDGTKLVKTANPWGRDVYTGDWSDKSPKWTEKFKQEVSHEEDSDGVFFQTLSQVKSDWQGFWYSSDIQGWQHSYWLNLDRDVSTPGAVAHWCKSANCRANNWEISSTVAQKVHIGILRHHNRAYRHCNNKPNDSTALALAFATGQPYYQHVQEGLWFEYDMSAGDSVKIDAEMDNLTGDLVNQYAIVAWAETEAVEIAHGGGAESDSYPHQASEKTQNKTDEQAEKEAARKAAEEAARKAEEARIAKEEAERKAAEEEAARKAAEEEAARKAEEARIAKEEAERKAAEEEAARKAEEARIAKEEAERKAAEESAARKAAEEEAARKAEEARIAKEEAERKAAEEEAARKAEESRIAKEEAERKAAEEEAARKAADAEAARKAAEEEAARKAEEARIAKEEAERKASEDEAVRKAAEEEAARKAEEARIAKEEAERKAAEEEERKADEERARKIREENARIAKEEAERKAAEEAAARKAADEEAARKAEEARIAKEEAERKAAEEEASRKEADRKAAEEEQRKADEERARKIREENARIAKEEAERKAAEEEERKADEERARKIREEKARIAKEEAERKQKEADEAARKAEEEEDKLDDEEKEGLKQYNLIVNDFDAYIAGIPISDRYDNCKHFQTETHFVSFDESEVKQFGHLCDDEDLLLQVTFPAECYDEKLLTLTSAHEEDHECVHSYRGVSCMFTVLAGQENALGMHIADTNCPVSMRRWWIEVEEEDEEAEPSVDEVLLTKEPKHDCNRPINRKRDNELFVGTLCEDYYVTGFLMMKPETWLSANIVEQFNYFDNCEAYQGGKYWKCYYDIYPGLENALFLQFNDSVSKYAYRSFKFAKFE